MSIRCNGCRYVCVCVHYTKTKILNEKMQCKFWFWLMTLLNDVNLTIKSNVLVKCICRISLDTACNYHEQLNWALKSFFTLAYGESTIKVTKILKVENEKEIQSVSASSSISSTFSFVTYFSRFIRL